MKYRTKQLTYIQRNLRRFHSLSQSIAAITGERLKKKKPRWRQLRKARKAREKRYASMKKRLAAQEPLKIDI